MRFVLTCGLLIFATISTSMGEELLDRGLVAVQTENGVFLSWRLLPSDDSNTTFDIFRDGRLLTRTEAEQGTNWQDSEGTADSQYAVTISGQKPEKAVSVWKDGFRTLTLDRPEAQTMPDGEVCEYAPNDMSVGDLDGDGRYELLVKWCPSNAKDNAHSGFTGTTYLDAYTLDGAKLWRVNLGVNVRAGAHYSPFLVWDFDGDGHAELMVKTADGTVDGTGKFLGNPDADYRNESGKILDGPEFLTVFDGRTGRALDSVPYSPPRDVVDGKTWGDSYGNRCDRFLAAVAFLDGTHPSALFCRGYYTVAYVAAFDFDGEKLRLRWFHRSETPGEGLYGEGNHNLAVGDLDGDGNDELVYGSAALDDDGTLLYRTGFGHGDALHLGDFDPARPGLEVWCVHESKSSPYGCELRAGDGSVLWGIPGNRDIGRGMTADFVPEIPGSECWSGADKNVLDCRGNPLFPTRGVSCNFRICWGAEPYDFLLDGTRITRYTPAGMETVVDFHESYGSASINGTKANPCLSCDFLGDWREEVIFYNAQRPAEIQLFTTTTPTRHRIPCLMYDHVYRLSVAAQNVGYNQPPHVGK